MSLGDGKKPCDNKRCDLGHRCKLQAGLRRASLLAIQSRTFSVESNPTTSSKLRELVGRQGPDHVITSLAQRPNYSRKRHHGPFGRSGKPEHLYFPRGVQSHPKHRHALVLGKRLKRHGLAGAQSIFWPHPIPRCAHRHGQKIPRNVRISCEPVQLRKKFCSMAIR